MWRDVVNFSSQHWLLETMMVCPLCGIGGLFAYLWSRGELGAFLRHFLEQEFPTVGPVLIAFLAKIPEKKKGVSIRASCKTAPAREIIRSEG
jgi:hypothetical protein